ncbi:MarR family winged helix-turn-helix transcriptional regulator [Desulfitobacterium sp. Sab5]|uniref:MarR family winged helix-turn-helix transcriptional regulator n=1 Tax=Desulfitobacterium nosdiversum TaxID=3375356 RepID=UPI003CF2E92F
MEGLLELGQELEETIREINTMMYRSERSILFEARISNSQFNALLKLKEFGSLTMGELCKHLFTACSTVTDLADRLERGGLVERIRDVKDRRIVHINLLPKGEEVVDAVIRERQVFLEKVMKTYSEEESAVLLKTLVNLVNRMGKEEKAYIPETQVL